MISFSRMKAVYEYTHYLYSRKIITRNVKIVPDIPLVLSYSFE